MNRYYYWLVLLSLVTLWSFSATASNGVLEINGDCASAGCFAGDSAGLPIQLTSAAPSANFILTSDIEQSSFSQGAFVIAVENATLDLNGFKVSGPVTCADPGVGNPVTCVGTSTAIGVDGSSTSGSVIQNGTIRGFSDGIHVGDGSRIDRIHTLENSDTGVRAGPRSVLTSVIAERNGAAGIDAAGAQRLAVQSVLNGSGSPSGPIVNFHGITGELVSVTVSGVTVTETLISAASRGNKPFLATQFCVVSADGDLGALQLDPGAVFVTDLMNDGCVAFGLGYLVPGSLDVVCRHWSGTSIEGCSVSGIIIE